MINITCERNNNEVSLSGLPQALRGIKQSILDLIKSEGQQACIIQCKVVDPSPYEVCLTSLSIIKTDNSIKVSICGDSLKIEGDIEKLETFANWFDFDDDTWSGYHVHFDSLGCEQWVNVASIPLIISVQNSVERVF